MRESFRVDSPFMGAGMPKAYSRDLRERSVEILDLIAQQPDLTLVETVAELRKRRIKTSRSSGVFSTDTTSRSKKVLQAAERHLEDGRRSPSWPLCVTIKWSPRWWSKVP